MALFDPRKILGMPPGPIAPAVLDAHFVDHRARLVAALGNPSVYEAARTALEDLYRAYRLLQRETSRGRWSDPEAELRDLIAASLEDGLLRHSRRTALLRHARDLGVNEFRAHLLIAETVVAESYSAEAPSGAFIQAPPSTPRTTPHRRLAPGDVGWREIITVAGLSVAMFLLFGQYFGV